MGQLWRACNVNCGMMIFVTIRFNLESVATPLSLLKFGFGALPGKMLLVRIIENN